MVSSENGGRSREPRTTRAAMTWTAVVAALVVFILLIVFFIQNQDTVEVHFLGLTGPVPLGVALFIAAVAGGVLVAVAGAVRIIQLRAVARRATRTPPSGRAPRSGPASSSGPTPSGPASPSGPAGPSGPASPAGRTPPQDR
ncbi:lipopolysaccharide assembly protein LapA domain-containing protein [Sinomonas sp. B1-1]|uniref:LapA family protein n=1 Tax=Sinomonas sp. B1-1 TaxID=3141454 RepID=UPI003D275AB1